MDSSLQSLTQIALSVLLAIGSVPSVIKIMAEIKHLRRVRRRAESEFAFKLSDRSSDPTLNRYAMELACAALVGDNHLTHQQRKVLLSLVDSEAVISKYIKAQRLVKINSGAPYIEWKLNRHKKPGSRRMIKILYYVAYLGFSTIAFLPLILHSFFPKNTVLNTAFWSFQAFWGVYFVAVSAFCLKSAAYLSLAEQLIEIAENSAQLQMPANGE